MGVLLRNGLEKLDKNVVFGMRGKGLLNAIIINNGIILILILVIEFFNDFKFFPTDHVDAFDFCLKLKENGLLSKPTHDNILRLAPPLIITEQQIEESLDILEKTVKEVKKH
jgi:ornithine--oxo-acid transaminase